MAIFPVSRGKNHVSQAVEGLGLTNLCALGPQGSGLELAQSGLFRPRKGPWIMTPKERRSEERAKARVRKKGSFGKGVFSEKSIF